VPPAACHTPTYVPEWPKMNHVWSAACPRRSIMPGLIGSGSTQSASSCLPHTNMCQNGQNESCLTRSMPQQVNHAWTGLGKHPECITALSRLFFHRNSLTAKILHWKTNDATMAHGPQISANTAPNHSIQLAISSTLHSLSSGSRCVSN
jgi:hypothetical protein